MQIANEWAGHSHYSANPYRSTSLKPSSSLSIYGRGNVTLLIARLKLLERDQTIVVSLDNLTDDTIILQQNMKHMQ